MGQTYNKERLNSELRNKYDQAVGEILKMENLPAYVTQGLFAHTDVEQTKRRRNDPKADALMWSSWLKIRREVQNRDNKAVERAIKRMPFGRVPSGEDIDLFYKVLMSELWVASNKETTVEDGGLGGSSAALTVHSWKQLARPSARQRPNLQRTRLGQ